MTDCVHNPDQWEWADCDKPEHEEGCYTASCPTCGWQSRDCED